MKQTQWKECETTDECHATCPWCGYVHVDSWEFPDSSDQECHSCNKPIHVYRRVVVTYATSKVES